MKKSIALSLALAASIGLAACSEKTQQEAGQAADSAGNDIEATVGEASADVEAGADAAGNSIDSALDSTGAAIEGAADGAANTVGSAMENAGEDLQN